MSSEQEARAAEAHVEARLAKLERLRERGIDPYPRRTERTHTAAEARALFEAEPETENAVAIAGRLMTIRGMGR